MLGFSLCSWMFIVTVLWFLDSPCEKVHVKSESNDDYYDEELCWLYD